MPKETNDEKVHKLAVRNDRKANEAVLREALLNNEEMNKMRESVQNNFGIDIDDAEEFPVTKPSFSFKKMRAKFEEADSATGFSQVLRAGVQTIVNSMYQSVQTTFEDWVHVIQSTKDTELYAPLHGITFPREVGRQEKYPESRAAGLDIKLKNRKYGTLYPIEKELLEDDQTGQFQQQAGLMGQYLKLVAEVVAYAKLASSASTMQYADLVVPATETKPTTEATYPWSTALVGGGSSRAATYGALTQANLQLGFQSLIKQKNLLGLQMMVQPDRVIIGPKYQFDLSVLLNSAYYPTGATAGAIGGQMSINPIKGIADVTVSRFIFRPDNGALDDSTAKAWWLVDSKVPWFVLQMREGAVVTQENPNAGRSFDEDVIRWKASTRLNADFIDPRFAYLGNDGSV